MFCQMIDSQILEKKLNLNELNKEINFVIVMIVKRK